MQLFASKNRFALLTSFVLASSLLILAGCSSKMTKSECESTDYYGMGVKDGEDGKSSERFDQVTQRCRDLGVEANAINYNKGRTVGLASYCTDSLGEKDAKKGSAQPVCMEAPPYKRAYSAKLNEMTAEAQQKLGKLKQSESALEKKQNDAQNKINELEAQKKAVQKK